MIKWLEDAVFYEVYHRVSATATETESGISRELQKN